MALSQHPFWRCFDNIVKRDWLGRCETLPPRDYIEAVVQSRDAASEASKFNDYFVCTTWGIKGASLFLLDLFRGKLVSMIGVSQSRQ
jgi:phage terminase large subunit-like protein